jgi:uncharacterized protein (TIGR02598 family)
VKAPGRTRAYSLVEVSLALGLMAIILTSIVALLPLGVRSTRETAQEARAIDYLTLIEADLRNTRTTDGLSPRFKLPLPYTLDAQGRAKLNSALTAHTIHAIGIRQDGTVSAPGAQCEHRFTLVYTSIPATAGSMAPLRARLISTWPCLGQEASLDDLTNPKRVSGFLESHLTFPSP